VGTRLNSWLGSFSSVKILEMTLREERQVKIATGSASRHAVGEARGKACFKGDVGVAD
jgi:hypothetical protein